MGGTVAVTFRSSEGDILPMHRWTNPLPGFAKDLRFINKDPRCLEDWLKSWREMKVDFEQHPDGKYELNMTSCYFSKKHPAKVAPFGYGLVVFDWQKNHILSMQSYCDFKTLYSASLRLGGAEEADEVKKLAKNKRIVGYRDLSSGLTENRVLSFEEVMAIANDRERKHGVFFNLDMSPFTVLDFEETTEGATQFRAKLKELGFPDDAKEWEDFIKEREN